MMFGLDLAALGWICVALIAVIASYIYMTWPYNYFKNRGIPGPKPVPFLGNMNEFGKVPFWLKDVEWAKKYGPVYGFFFFGKKSLMVSDKEMLKEIFIKDFDNFCDRLELPNRGVLKYGLFDMTGQAWRTQRHQLSPYFSAGTMKMSAGPINKILDNLTTWLEEKSTAGEMVEAREFAQMMTMDVICSTAFGVEVNSCKNPDIEVLTQARKLFKLANAGNKMLMLVLLFPKIGKILDALGIESFPLDYYTKFTKHIIQQRKDMTEKGGHDFVNVLLKERKDSTKGLSDDEIIANAILFLLAGYDTTSGTLAFLIYNLVVYEECQEKVYQEIQDVIGNEKPTYENVQQLSYLEMCLDETLRLFPLAVRLDRKCVKDTVVKGVAIEKGMAVAMPVWYLHRDPEVWEDPETFKPERFTSENKKSRDPTSYVPFGLGPRHCIGMRLALLELKIAVVRILQKFKVVKNEKTQVPLELDPKAFGMAAKEGIWVSLEKRC